MKKNLFTTLMTGVAAIFSVASCNPEDNALEPNFPEPFDNTVSPGESYTFSINPNQNWTVTIPASEAGNLFWIEDGDRHVTTIGGQAGEYEITIGVAAQTDFESHTLTVSMTMGGITRPVGILRLPAAEYEFSLYGPAKNESGDFIQLFDQEFGYQYDRETTINPLTDVIRLEWPSYSSIADFLCPVLIVSNDNFIVSPETSSWLSVVYGGESGSEKEAVISLRMDSPDVPVDGNSEGQVVFVNSADETEKVVYNVTLPALNSIIRFMGATRPGPDSELAFDAEGMQSGSSLGSGDVIGSFAAMDGVVTYTLEKTESGMMPTCSWLVPSCEPQTEGLFRTYMYTIAPEANDNEESRSAVVVILPAGIASGISHASGLLDEESDYMDIKAEYKEYAFSVTQAGRQTAQTGGAITFTLSETAESNDNIKMVDYSEIINDALDSVMETMDFAGATKIINGIEVPALSAMMLTDLEQMVMSVMEGGPYPTAYYLSYSDISVHSDMAILDVMIGSAAFTANVPAQYKAWLAAFTEQMADNGLTISMVGEDPSGNAGYLNYIGKVQIFNANGKLASIVYCLRNFGDPEPAPEE